MGCLMQRRERPDGGFGEVVHMMAKKLKGEALVNLLI
jgi:hypothetical protein